MGDVRQIKRALLRAAIFALCVTALVAIVAVLSARLDQTEEQILFTHVGIAVYSLFALAAAAAAPRRPQLAVAGWVCSGIGLLLFLIGIWAAWDGYHPALWRWTAIFFALSFTLAHVSLLESRRRETDSTTVSGIASATTVVSAMLCFMVVVGIASEQSVSDAYLRFLGVLGVLDVLGTVVLPIARKIDQSPAGEA